MAKPKIKPHVPATLGLNLVAGDRSLKWSEEEGQEAAEIVNVELSYQGGIAKCNGNVEVLDAALTGTGTVQGMSVYRKSDGTSELIAVHEGTVYRVNTSLGTVTSLLTGLSVSARCYFATFNDYLIISNGTDAPRKYDGTTVTTLSGFSTIESSNRFKYMAVWKNRLWVAGCPAKPYRVFYSEPGDLQGWDTADGAGSFDVNLNDGQIVTGLAPFIDQLIVGKGMSLHAIVGDSAVGSDGPNEFRQKPVSLDRGCLANDAMVLVQNSLMGLDENGIWALSTSDKFGDVSTDDVSLKVRPRFSSLNATNIHNAFAVHHKIKQQVWFFISTGSSTTNDTVLVYDYSLGAWWERSGLSGHCGVYLGGYPYTGTFDGQILQQDIGGNYAGEAIQAYYTEGWNDFRAPLTTKRIRSGDITFLTQSTYDLSLYSSWDYDASSTVRNINQGPVGGSGAVWGTAVWGTSVWYTSSNRQARTLVDFGMGKVHRLKFYNYGTDQPFRVFAWDLSWIPLGNRPASS